MSIDKPLATNHACVTGTVNVLHQAVKAGVKRVVYAASSSAYGDRPYSRNVRPTCLKCSVLMRPRNWPASFTCKPFIIVLAWRPVGLRYFNVFGPRQDPASPYSAVIPVVCYATFSGNRTDRLRCDGGQSRDFTFVGNVVQGNLLAGEVEGIGGQIMNMADGRRTTLLQLLELLAKYLGVPGESRFPSTAYRRCA